MTKKQLAAQMGFDPSYVSHVEGRRHRPTEDFARRAEAVLGAGGAIWLRFQEYDELRHARGRPRRCCRDPPVPEQWMPPGTGLIVEQEVAELAYADGDYRCVIRRALYNAGTEPVTRYLVRIAVDRYPQRPAALQPAPPRPPADLRRAGPAGVLRRPPTREPMQWRPKLDRDAFKEVWLLFENDRRPVPALPRRADHDRVRLHGRRGEVGAVVPARRPAADPAARPSGWISRSALDPQVWGVETSLSAEEAPLRTPVEQRGRRRPGRLRVVHRRAAAERPLPAGVAVPRSPAARRVRRRRRRVRCRSVERHARRTRASGQRADARHRHRAARRRPAAQRLGTSTARERAAARDVVDGCCDTLDRVEELHPSRKGVGLAAPQIGLAVAAAVVRPPDRRRRAVVLLNPRVVDASRGDRRAVRGLPVLLRRARAGAPAAADRGGARPLRRDPA